MRSRAGQLGFVTGSKVEAAIIAGRFPAICTGLRAGGAAADIKELAGRVSALVSFGFAGGLAPALRPGDLVLADSVRDTHGGRRAVHAGLRDWIAAALPAVNLGAVIGHNRVVMDAAEKTALHATGAIAVDMESHAVADAAARADLPFAVLRAISDSADRDLPPVAAHLVRDDGGVAVGPLLGAATRPAHIPPLVRLARDSGRAKRSLQSAVAALSALPPFGI